MRLAIVHASHDLKTASAHAHRPPDLSAIYAVQAKWCKLCGVSYVVQSIWCELRGVSYVVQYMWCKLCGAIYVVQYVLCRYVV